MKKEPKDVSSKNNTRRDFLKLSGVLGGSALLSSPLLAMAERPSSGKPAMAGAAGKGHGGPDTPIPTLDPTLIGKALNSLIKTYAKPQPYQHKFNDALTKSWLNSIDFSVKNGIQDKYVKHYLHSLREILKREKKMVEKMGKDEALNAMFEGTVCSVQLFEEINIKKNERTYPCPYKAILEVCKPLDMFSIKWKDVCNKHCIPLYTGFGEMMGVKVKIIPGEICTARV